MYNSCTREYLVFAVSLEMTRQDRIFYSHFMTIEPRFSICGIYKYVVYLIFLYI